MKCPKCGSEDCQYVTNTETYGNSFSFSKACCGSILLGPIGILCGSCGAGVYSETHEYWICNTCGRRFSKHEAQKNMEREAKKIEKFMFYKEIQAKSMNVNDVYETELGEKIKEGTELYLDIAFDKTEIIKTNPLLEDKRIEDIKNVIGSVLNKNELVHLIFPDEKLIFAEKGIIYNNYNYGMTTQIRLYKNYVYLGQYYITMPTELKAEALYKFIKYISTGIKTESSERQTNYLTLLSEIQSLQAEDSQRIEHFSSQQEYEDYVKMVFENSFEKFRKVDPINYEEYEKMEVELDDLMERMSGYTKWMIIAALGVGIIAGVEEGIVSGIIVAFIEAIVFVIYVAYKGCRVSFIQDKYVPTYLNEVRMENQRSNNEKKGNILVCDYMDVIHRTF